MRKKIMDDDMPVGKLTRIPDFLPPPEELVMPDEKTIKVTISLSQASVAFFKRQSRKH